jgi:hypothetical protein
MSDDSDAESVAPTEPTDHLVESFPLSMPIPDESPAPTAGDRRGRYLTVRVPRPPTYEVLPPSAPPERTSTLDRVIDLAPGLVEPYVARGFGAIAEGRFADAARDLTYATVAGTRDPFAFLELSRLASPRFDTETVALPPIAVGARHLLHRAEELAGDLDDVVALVRLERACIDPEDDVELVPAMAEAGLRSRREPVCRIVEASVFAAYPLALEAGGHELAGHVLEAGLEVAPRDAALSFLEVLHTHRGKPDAQIRWQRMVHVLFDDGSSDEPESASSSQSDAVQFASTARRLVDRRLTPLHGVRVILRRSDVAENTEASDV